MFLTVNLDSSLEKSKEAVLVQPTVDFQPLSSKINDRLLLNQPKTYKFLSSNVRDYYH
jgi:hypothetical protein